MDSIFIENLVIEGRHGVGAKEKRVLQKFVVDIRAKVNTKASVLSDNLSDTSDYRKFEKIARDVIERRTFSLIEKIAGTISEKILAVSGVEEVSVCIRKPAALSSGLAGCLVVRNSSWRSS